VCLKIGYSSAFLFLMQLRVIAGSQAQKLSKIAWYSSHGGVGEPQGCTCPGVCTHTGRTPCILWLRLCEGLFLRIVMNVSRRVFSDPGAVLKCHDLLTYLFTYLSAGWFQHVVDRLHPALNRAERSVYNSRESDRISPSLLRNWLHPQLLV